MYFLEYGPVWGALEVNMTQPWPCAERTLGPHTLVTACLWLEAPLERFFWTQLNFTMPGSRLGAHYHLCEWKETVFQRAFLYEWSWLCLFVCLWLDFWSYPLRSAHSWYMAFKHGQLGMVYACAYLLMWTRPKLHAHFNAYTLFMHGQHSHAYTFKQTWTKTMFALSA